MPYRQLYKLGSNFPEFWRWLIPSTYKDFLEIERLQKLLGSTKKVWNKIPVLWLIVKPDSQSYSQSQNHS